MYGLIFWKIKQHELREDKVEMIMRKINNLSKIEGIHIFWKLQKLRLTSWYLTRYEQSEWNTSGKKKFYKWRVATVSIIWKEGNGIRRTVYVNYRASLAICAVKLKWYVDVSYITGWRMFEGREMRKEWNTCLFRWIRFFKSSGKKSFNEVQWRSSAFVFVFVHRFSAITREITDSFQLGIHNHF